MKNRLLWHVEHPMSAMELHERLSIAASSVPPCILATIGELQRQPGADSLFYRNTALGHAVELAPMDGGERLCALAEELGHAELRCQEVEE